MRARVTLAFALGAIGLAACFDPAAQEMKITQVTPFTLRAGRTVQVAINGNFYVSTDMDFGDNVGPTVDDSFAATLDGVALTNVVYQSNTELQATVPGKLGAGTHALTVNAPDGTSVTLENAVMVSLFGGAGSGSNGSGSGSGGN